MTSVYDSVMTGIHIPGRGCLIYPWLNPETDEIEVLTSDYFALILNDEAGLLCCSPALGMEPRVLFTLSRSTQGDGKQFTYYLLNRSGPIMARVESMNLPLEDMTRAALVTDGQPFSP